MPSSSKLGGVSAWYMLLFFLCLLGLSFKILQKKLRYSDVLFGVSVPFFFLLSSMAFSLLTSTSYAVGGDILELLRVIVNLSVLVFAYNYSSLNTGRFFYRFYIWFIPFEIFISIIQKHSGIKSVLSMIWNMEKAWFLRSTGTLANPNVLALYLIVGYVFIAFSEYSSKKVKLIYYLMVFVGVGLTGSRTGLLVFVIMSAIIYLVKTELTMVVFLKFIMFFLIGLTVLISILKIYSRELGYMAQILNVYENGSIDFSRVGTFTARLEMWSRNFSVLKDVDPLKYLIGMGPGKDIGLRVMDNEYLSQFLRYGFLGMIFNFIMLFVLVFQVFKQRFLIGYGDVKFVCVVFVLMGFYGLVSASYSSVLNLLPMMFFIGATLRKAEMIKKGDSIDN